MMRDKTITLRKKRAQNKELGKGQKMKLTNVLK